MTATVRDLLAELGPATDFADAPCVGRWAWFDPPNDHEPAASVKSRHEAAVHVCGTCPLPTMARCTATARTLLRPSHPERHPPMNIPPNRVVSTGRRAPSTRCAAPGCPYLSRTTYCPLHNRVDPVPDTDHHPKTGRESHRAEGAPAMALGPESMAGERVIPAL